MVCTTIHHMGIDIEFFIKWKKLPFLTYYYLVGIARYSPMNAVNVLFLRFLYGVVLPTPEFVTLFETSVVYKKHFHLWQTTREGFFLSQMIPIDLHTTETQNVQSTIHYLSKCFVQIKEKDMYIPNLLFRCIHRHDDMMF